MHAGDTHVCTTVERAPVYFFDVYLWLTVLLCVNVRLHARCLHHCVHQCLQQCFTVTTLATFRSHQDTGRQSHP